MNTYSNSLHFNTGAFASHNSNVLDFFEDLGHK